MSKNVLSHPNGLSSQVTLKVDHKGVRIEHLEVKTDLPLFPDDDGFDKKRFNELLNEIGTWTATDPSREAHITRLARASDLDTGSVFG